MHTVHVITAEEDGMRFQGNDMRKHVRDDEIYID